MAAFVPAVLADVEKRTISILNANPGTFDSVVATNDDGSGKIGAFPTTEEIIAACLEADSNVAVYGYFQSGNDALANYFGVTSAPLGDRDNIPFHHGTLNKVEVAYNTNAFTLTSSNIFTATGFGLTTGQLVSLISTGTLPTGLSTLTNYFVIALTANTFSLATTLANALAGTAITVTYPGGVGSGVHTMIAWQIGVEAKNIDDITNATAVGEAYVGSGAFDFLYKEDSGVIYTTATYARVTYPEYIKTEALQCNENEKTLIICEAIAILTKNASPAPFEVYRNERDRGFQQLTQDGIYSAQINLSDVGQPQ